MSHPLLIFSQSDYLIQVVDTISHSKWQTEQIQISWLLQKPTDLALHCLQRQGISRFSRTRVNIFNIDLGFTALSRIFHLYRADRSSKVDENRRTRRKTTWPSVSRTWLSHMWPERGSNHSGEKPKTYMYLNLPKQCSTTASKVSIVCYSVHTFYTNTVNVLKVWMKIMMTNTVNVLKVWMEIMMTSKFIIYLHIWRKDKYGEYPKIFEHFIPYFFGLNFAFYAVESFGWTISLMHKIMYTVKA